MKNRSIAIITARGGSKRIPRKNIREFCGKPILAYSIEAAQNAGVFDEIMVSTDDEEIAKTAKQYGASIPFFRSKENAGDYAVTADVVKEVLTEYKRLGQQFEFACCIYPTAPFLTGEKLRKAMEELTESDLDSVMPVTAFSFPPQRGMYIRGGQLIFCYPENDLKRSQDLETMYHDCGQFYCVRTPSFLQTGKLVMEKTGAVILPESEVQDIDNLEDWKIAEMKYRFLKGEFKQ
jgi:pseudaminic acid CMP-transferase